MKIKKAIKIILLAVCSLMVATYQVKAQKRKTRKGDLVTDTLAPLRDFVQISTGYKQVPMYLNLELNSKTNFITSENDTAKMTAEFFVQSGQSYVRFGEIEQVINDSMALLVSNRLQSMVLFTDATPVIKQMRAMMGLAIPDSSIKKMADYYTSASKKDEDGAAMVEMTSRSMLYGTSTPKQVISMKYDVISRVPKQVTTVYRSLIPVDSADYSQLYMLPANASMLLALEGSYFLIKEQIAEYIYRKIERQAVPAVPVVIADRIRKNQEGEYIPVKGYEEYTLTNH